MCHFNLVIWGEDEIITLLVKPQLPLILDNRGEPAVNSSLLVNPKLQTNEEYYLFFDWC